MRLLLCFCALLVSVAARHRQGPPRTEALRGYPHYKTTITGRLLCPPTGVIDKTVVGVDMSLEIIHRGSDDSAFVNQTVIGRREFRFVAEHNDFSRSLHSSTRHLRFHVGGYGCGEKTFDLGKPDMTGTKLDGTIMEFFFLGDIPMAGYAKPQRHPAPSHAGPDSSEDLVPDY